jgi:hypothetical protein
VTLIDRMTHELRIGEDMKGSDCILFMTDMREALKFVIVRVRAKIRAGEFPVRRRSADHLTLV